MALRAGRKGGRGQRPVGPAGLGPGRCGRPSSIEALVQAPPPSVTRIAVLDRTKEPGSVGEPLYLDVVAALREQSPSPGREPRVIGGRYGLGSKEFTPAMVKSVLDHLT